GRSVASNVKKALPDSAKASTRFEPLLDMPGAYDRLVEKLQRDPPDVIYMTLQSGPSVEFLRALQRYGMKSGGLGGQQMPYQSFWLAAREAAEGIRVLAPISSVDTPEFRRAVDLLEQAQIVPDLVALSSFAAVQTWAEGVRRAGEGDPKKVVEALRQGMFQTA